MWCFAYTKLAVEKNNNKKHLGSRFNMWSVFNDYLGQNLMLNIDPGHFSTLNIDPDHFSTLNIPRGSVFNVTPDAKIEINVVMYIT